MTGRSERLPELLVRYPYNTNQDVYAMALYFLIEIGQCPIKNEKEVLNPELNKIKDECQSKFDQKQSGMDNGMLSLLWQCQLTLKSNSKWAVALANVIRGGQFLPTMPHDETFEAKQVLTGQGGVRQWYQCRNGHTFGIGECGKPTQQAKCHCGQPIGGTK
jgi:hypothetical protein